MTGSSTAAKQCLFSFVPRWRHGRRSDRTRRAASTLQQPAPSRYSVPVVRDEASATAGNGPGELTPSERATLLALARDSIARGARGESAQALELDTFPPGLTRQAACFITLYANGELRGCIGTLTARRALVTEVVHMARAAAFEDPRFPPVAHAELDGLQISVSVLSPAEPMSFTSERDLVSQLRPGVDGLILRDGANAGTFLPSVWEKIPEPADFLNHLKRKAGLPMSHWSNRLTMHRYTTESFSDL